VWQINIENPCRPGNCVAGHGRDLRNGTFITGHVHRNAMAHLTQLQMASFELAGRIIAYLVKATAPFGAPLERSTGQFINDKEQLTISCEILLELSAHGQLEICLRLLLPKAKAAFHVIILFAASKLNHIRDSLTKFPFDPDQARDRRKSD